MAAFDDKELLIHNALMDNFDTPLAITELSNLVKAANTYLMQPATEIKLPLIHKVRRYVHRILTVFGVFEEELGGSLASEGQGLSKEDVLEPLMKALMEFRLEVKSKASEGKGPIMEATDLFRDDKLAEIGIRLQDKGADRSTWSLEQPEVLLKERREKVQAKAKKEEEKRQREAEALRKKSTSGKDLFTLLDKGDFTACDENGVPTHKKGKKNKEKDGSITFGPDVEV